MQQASCDISGFMVNLKIKEEAGIAAAVVAFNDVGQQTIGDAQNMAPIGGKPYSPNDPAPGTLVASGVAEKPRVEGTQIIVDLGFNTVYAAVQHNRLDFRHSHGQAEYLKVAVARMEPRAPQIVGDAVKRAVEK